MKGYRAFLATMRHTRRDFLAVQTMPVAAVTEDMIDVPLTDLELGAAGRALLIEADPMKRAAVRLKVVVTYLQEISAPYVPRGTMLRRRA